MKSKSNNALVKEEEIGMSHQHHKGSFLKPPMQYSSSKLVKPIQDHDMQLNPEITPLALSKIRPNSASVSSSASFSRPLSCARKSARFNDKKTIVLRKCEDIQIRTGGFQKIEQETWRPLDLRRHRHHSKS
jgi:hypothetical protein